MEGYYAAETKWRLGGVIAFGLDRTLLGYQANPTKCFPNGQRVENEKGLSPFETALLLAEKEGFEPSLELPPLTV